MTMHRAVNHGTRYAHAWRPSSAWGAASACPGIATSYALTVRPATSPAPDAGPEVTAHRTRLRPTRLRSRDRNIDNRRRRSIPMSGSSRRQA